MKAIPKKLVKDGDSTVYQTCSPDEATHLSFRTPGCFYFRMIPVATGFGPRWDWNKSVDKPTLTPSLLARAGEDRCHSYVRDGEIQFLSDCSHEFAGQTLPLYDVDESTPIYKD